jgi:hypothetical protein
MSVVVIAAPCGAYLATWTAQASIRRLVCAAPNVAFRPRKPMTPMGQPAGCQPAGCRQALRRRTQRYATLRL